MSGQRENSMPSTMFIGDNLYCDGESQQIDVILHSHNLQFCRKQLEDKHSYLSFVHLSMLSYANVCLVGSVICEH